MKYLLSAGTDIGLKKKENQDSVLVKRAICNDEQVVLAVMCDGMGGLKKGEIASASLVNAFRLWFEKQLPDILRSASIEKELLFSWDSLIRKMNHKICAYGTEHRLQLGSTVTAMLFWQEEYYLVHVGDSRAYELKERIVQLTKDQTLVQREVDEGLLAKEAAEKDPRRNVLLQCIGVLGEVKPVYIKGTIQKDAVYLLCCDGFRHELDAAEIYRAFDPKLMRNEEMLQQAAKQTIQMNKDRGEQDNISVIAIRTWQGG